MHVIAAHRRFRSKPQRSNSASQSQMTEMANQIKLGRVYHSQMHSISSDANYLNFFSNMAILRERERVRERERESERERWENCKHLSLSTNNEAEFSYLKYMQLHLNITHVVPQYHGKNITIWCLGICIKIKGINTFCINAQTLWLNHKNKWWIRVARFK